MGLELKNARLQLSRDNVLGAASAVSSRLKVKLEEREHHSMSSVHEILGLLVEEQAELIVAVHEGEHADVRAELIDVAVAAILGIACIDADTLDW